MFAYHNKNRNGYCPVSLVIDIRRIIQILCIIALKVTAIDVQFFKASFLLISIQTYSLLILKAIFTIIFFLFKKKVFTHGTHN